MPGKNIIAARDETFDAVLIEMKMNPARRWLLNFIGGKPNIQPVPDDAYCMSFSEMAEGLAKGPGWGMEFVTDKELADMVQACGCRLAASMKKAPAGGRASQPAPR